MAAMNLSRIVRDIQRATRENQTELARRFGVTQPTVSRWIKGAQPELQHHDRVMEQARRLGVLADGDGLARLVVPIIGYVGAGGAVLFGEGQGPFGDAPVPPQGAGPTTVAVEVRGDSMAGMLEDGWIVYYDDRRDPPTEDLYGKLCVIGLIDGRVLIKKLQKGHSPGLFHIYSANAAPLFDQRVDWAARVTWIYPV